MHPFASSHGLSCFWGLSISAMWGFIGSIEEVSSLLPLASGAHYHHWICRFMWSPWCLVCSFLLLNNSDCGCLRAVGLSFRFSIWELWLGLLFEGVLFPILFRSAMPAWCSSRSSSAFSDIYRIGFRVKILYWSKVLLSVFFFLDL